MTTPNIKCKTYHLTASPIISVVALENKLKYVTQQINKIEDLKHLVSVELKAIADGDVAIVFYESTQEKEAE